MAKDAVRMFAVQSLASNGLPSKAPKEYRLFGLPLLWTLNVSRPPTAKLQFPPILTQQKRPNFSVGPFLLSQRRELNP